MDVTPLPIKCTQTPRFYYICTEDHNLSHETLIGQHVRLLTRKLNLRLFVPYMKFRHVYKGWLVSPVLHTCTHTCMCETYDPCMFVTVLEPRDVLQMVNVKKLSIGTLMWPLWMNFNLPFVKLCIFLYMKLGLLSFL